MHQRSHNSREKAQDLPGRAPEVQRLQGEVQDVGRMATIQGHCHTFLSLILPIGTGPRPGNDDHDRSMIAIIMMIDDRFWMMTIIDRNNSGIVCQNHLKFGVLRLLIGDS